MWIVCWRSVELNISILYSIVLKRLSCLLNHIFEQLIFTVKQPRLTTVESVALHPGGKAFCFLLWGQSFVWIFVHGEQSGQKQWSSRVISCNELWLFSHFQVPAIWFGGWTGPCTCTSVQAIAGVMCRWWLDLVVDLVVLKSRGGIGRFCWINSLDRMSWSTVVPLFSR